jgi:hypothetical protein
MKKCRVCNKHVPKRYIEAHERYHDRKETTIERCQDRKKAAIKKAQDYLKTLRKIEL